MMRILILVLVCLSWLNISAQLTLEVKYYKPLESAGGAYLEQNSNFALYCTPHRSLFIFEKGENTISEYQDELGNVDAKYWLDAGENWIYKDFATNDLTQLASSIQENEYLIQDEIHPMQWEIKQESKDINGILVQKAVCEYRGRSYIAWFAPAIPIQHGPWKLGGLPGLILEAFDAEKEVVFLLKSIRAVNDQQISKPKLTGRKVSIGTYLDLNEKEFRQYVDFLAARLKKDDADFDVEISIGKFSAWEYLK